MASPPVLRAAAARLDREAAALPHALVRVVRASGDEAWRGPAAERFGAELRLRRRRLDDVAGRLRMTASRLRRQADAVEADGRPDQARRSGGWLPGRVA